ncbi:PREDICTED: uncharacterized protein LOC104725406 isoform X2 [Camelina sativa]|uniref:Uncharacterized protein LOC104725406 isoform X2 n=1 Tax=Camelina sativa TaxID=90675 RepID=A0ABM0UK92_CAMSA|nr:PREDICTED: uncharacterized protein LOC104725406 isoform X2 [Camelina sativa]
MMLTSDIKLLKRAWRNEKAAPGILQYEGALVERAKEQNELVIEKFLFHNLKSEEAERRLPEQDKVFATRLFLHISKRQLLKESYLCAWGNDAADEVENYFQTPS